MFALRTRPLEIEAGRLRGLRLSLNSPVVRVPELPTGAARAAIVVQEGAAGAALAVAVRSLEGPEMAVYQMGGEELREVEPGQILDAALCFAEGMGFLFDDEEVDPSDPASREQALARWRSFRAGPPRAAVASGAGDREAGEDAIDLTVEEEAAPPVSRPEVNISAPELTLTKFRVRGEPASHPEPPMRRKRRAVGLIRLVQRVARRTEAPPSGLLQLLGQF